MGLPIIGDIIKGVTDLIDKAIPDADKKIELKLELAKLQDQAQARVDEQLIAQVEVNKIEASSSSLFVAGWRPAIGWVGAAALAYSYIMVPFIGIWTVVPTIDFDGLYNIVIAMLGVGAMRTVEKVKGVSTTSISQPKETAPPPTTVIEKPKKEKMRWTKI